MNTIRPNSAIMNLLATNGQYGKQEQIRNERRSDQIHREPQSNELEANLGVAALQHRMLIGAYRLSWWDYARMAQQIEEAIVDLSRNP